jgi:hypothetical protein
MRTAICVVNCLALLVVTLSMTGIGVAQTTWGPEEQLTETMGVVLGTRSVASYGNNVHVTYEDVDEKSVKYGRSTDMGGSWNVASEIIDPESAGASEHSTSSIAASFEREEEVFIVYGE